MHDPEDRSFFGHPRGLAYIAFTEAWERFSYYGMQALLVLYMVNRLLHPGHMEHVAGFGPFRHLLETVYRGPLSVQALASAIFGLYTGFVYLTPIAGGLIADRLLGRTRTITIGALLMAAGHFLMAFDVTFLLALVCLLSGVGCFKGNLALRGQQSRRLGRRFLGENVCDTVLASARRIMRDSRHHLPPRRPLLRSSTGAGR